MSKMLKPAQVAEMLSISLRTVQHWCKTGVLSATKVGGVYRISEQNLEDFLNNSNSKTNKNNSSKGDKIS